MSQPTIAPVDYYFAYGSNMNPDRVRLRGMVFDHVMAGVLGDYALRFNKRSVKYPGAASANVVAHAGAVTEGVLYRLSHPDQILAMDPFEGYPVRYDRLVLPVRSGGGACAAWVYIANADHIAEGLLPARWYLDHLLAGSAYLSEPYVNRLRATECLPDSTGEPS